MNRDENKVLGKSFEELLNDPSLNKVEKAIEKKDNAAVIKLSISKIKNNPFQKEKNYPKEKIESLAKSISENGIVNPIRVRYINGEYQIVTGYKRLQAAKLVGLDVVPVFLENISDERLLEMYLLDSYQKEHISPIEEAKSYVLIQEKHNLSIDELASQLSKSRSYVANIIRLLNLPLSVQSLVDEEKLSIGHARALLGLEEDIILILVERIEKEKLSVREIEKIVNELKDNKKRKSTDFSYKILKDSVKIYYKDEEELNKILSKLNLK